MLKTTAVAGLCSRLAVAAALIFATVAEAKEVTLSHKGLVLNANLELAAGKKLADGAILITHAGLAHRGMEVIAYLQNLFKERGYNTLAINLSLGLDNRHDMYDCKVTHRHRNDDAAEEIGVWVNWLKKQGAKRMTVMGHSRGGAQTALYAAERDEAAVNAVVLLAPAIHENTDAAGYQRRYQQPLAPVLEQAQNLVREGKGGTVLERANLLTCADAPVTAESFVSYYGPQARVDSPSLIPKIKKPVLVVIAGNDEIVIGLEQKVAPLADGKRVQMKVVDGADHFFRDLYADDAVETIAAFLKGAAGGF
ncbi:MAG: alpha/beta fold hydrolase [Gammaproteobacteria bacterium]|nr:MAG: alpha/beta fold hydrolase [Gammaproteobacteria bacterium]